MSPRSVGRAKLGRQRGVRQERKRLLIVTEGEETEPQYFEVLARFARATGVDVYAAKVIGLGCDPLTLVRQSIRRRADAGEDAYHEVWCVCDVDEHDTLPSAISVARRERINLAITNPCFELWLLWHYRDYGRSTDKRLLKKALKPYGITDKHLPAKFPFSAYPEAVVRAQQRQADTGTYDVPPNPGASVGRVVKLIAASGSSPRGSRGR